MPGYKGHIAGGIMMYGVMIIPIFFTMKIVPIIALEWFVCAIAGSLFPDIDIKSKGQKYFYYIIIILFSWFVARGFYNYALGISFFAMTPMLVKHRGIFHRYWFVIGVPFILWFSVYMYFTHFAKTIILHTIFFVGGAISHLLLDYKFRYIPFLNHSFFGKHAKRKK